jgi:hypothetical protein
MKAYWDWCDECNKWAVMENNPRELRVGPFVLLMTGYRHCSTCRKCVVRMLSDKFPGLQIIVNRLI